MYDQGVACGGIFLLSRDWHRWPSRARHWCDGLSLLFSGSFFQCIFQSWETHFLRVSMRSVGAIGFSGAGCHFAASLAVELASSFPGTPWNDEVRINLRMSCWLDTVFLIMLTMEWWGCLVEESACMADIESVYMTLHFREFCVMCCIASRIACMWFCWEYWGRR